MTAAHDPGGMLQPGHAATLDGGEIRMPYWLARPHRAHLAQVVAAAAASADTDPMDVPVLNVVLTELMVAPARCAIDPVAADRVRRASGMTSDHVPVRMSGAEVDVVIRWGNCSPDVIRFLRRDTASGTAGGEGNTA